MADAVMGISVYLLPGMTVIIDSPVTPNNNNGWFVAGDGAVPQAAIDAMSDPGPVINGFIVENQDVGNIVAAGNAEDGAAVIYTHNKAAENTVWFFASTTERGLVNIVSVPIHDHSSVVQGGPAFGTYFSDDEGV